MVKSIQLKQGVFTPKQTSPTYIHYQYCFPFDMHYFDSGSSVILGQAAAATMVPLVTIC